MYTILLSLRWAIVDCHCSDNNFSHTKFKIECCMRKVVVNKLK